MSKSKSKSKSSEQHQIRDIRSTIRATMLGKETTDILCESLLRSGADFIDPAGSTIKSSDEIVEFLEHTSSQVGTWYDLSDGRRALLKTICDVYCRELAAQKEDARAA